MLLVIALVAVLAFWATRPGGGGSQNTAGSNDGSGPAPSITPGPSASESLIDERPGGREEPGRTSNVQLEQIRDRNRDRRVAAPPADPLLYPARLIPTATT